MELNVFGVNGVNVTPEVAKWLHEQPETNEVKEWIGKREEEHEGYGRILLEMLESKVHMHNKFKDDPESEEFKKTIDVMAMAGALASAAMKLPCRQMAADLKWLEDKVTKLTVRMEEVFPETAV